MELGYGNKKFYHKSSCHMRNDNTNWGMVNGDGKIVILNETFKRQRTRLDVEK